MICVLLIGMHRPLRSLALIATMALLTGGSRAAEQTPTRAYKVALADAFESGSDARVRRNLVTVYRRAVARNPEKVSAFAKLLAKAMKGFSRTANPQQREEFLTNLSVATMKGYDKRFPRFDRKVEDALGDVIRIVRDHEVTAGFTDRLYLRLLPIHLKAGEAPQVLQDFLKNPWGIIFDEL